MRQNIGGAPEAPPSSGSRESMYPGVRGSYESKMAADKTELCKCRKSAAVTNCVHWEFSVYNYIYFIRKMFRVEGGSSQSNTTVSLVAAIMVL